MNEHADKHTANIPDAILEHASIWHARMQECDVNTSQGRQLKVQFNTWLLADPLHRRAYDEMSAIWQLLAHPELSEDTPITKNTSIKSVKSRWYGAVASLALFVIVAGIGWQQNWPLRLQSDYYSYVGEQTVVTLDDNSEVILNSNSAINVNFSEQLREVTLLKGEARFNIAKNSRRPFVVNTAQGQVTVTGTQFNVSLNNKEAIVSLLEGSVKLLSNTVSGQRKNLSVNQQAKLTAQGISAVNEFDAQAVTAWQRGQIVFYSASLSEVVAKLNRYRKGKIIISDHSLNQLQVSGVFSTNAPDAALEMIIQTLSIQQTRLTDYLVLLH